MSLSGFFYSYTDAGFDPSIDCQLEGLCPVDLGPISLVPGLSNLGSLERLPTEILLSILEDIPLISLIRFRNISRRTRYFVDTMPKFRTIVEQAPNAIRGILAVQDDMQTTLNELFKKLCQRECDRCDALAQHLWLPTTSRLCFSCTSSGPGPHSMEKLVNICGFTPEELKALPSFRLLPAKVSLRDFLGKERDYDLGKGSTLYDTTGMWTLAYKTGKVWPPPLTVDFFRSGRIRDCGETSVNMEEHSADISPDMLPMGIRRNMATILAPWIGAEGPEMGFFCKACLYTDDQDTIYRSTDFLEHLESCRIQPFDEIEHRSRYLISSN